HFGIGGFGAGNGGVSFAYRADGSYQAKIGNVGGGGLGAGGGIFVQEGGTLILESGSLSGGSVAGGAAGPIQPAHQVYSMPGAGQGLGSGIFLQGNETLTFAPASGATVTVADVIADQGGNGGRGAVDIKGTGIVELDAANTYSGGTTIEAGATLQLGAAGSLGTGAVTNNGTLHLIHATTVANAVVDNNDVLLDGSETYTFASAISGSGTITFGSGWTTLAFNSGAPTPVIRGFGVGDVIDLKAVAATGVGSYVNGILTLTGAGGAVVGTLNFDPAQADLVSTGFRVVPDGNGGTYVVLNGIQTVFEISTFADFQAALTSIKDGGINSAANTAYTINIHANLSVTAFITAIDMASGDTLTIHGLGHTIDGAVNGVATYSGLYLRSGSLAVSDLTIQNTIQRGGDGTGDPHSRNGAGGGGLGAGGGLFVGAGASAMLDNVSFTGDRAIGGNGGRGYNAVPPVDTDIGRGGLFEGRYNYNNGYGGFGTGGRGSNGFIGSSNGGFGAGGGGGASFFSNNPSGFHSSGQNGAIGGYGAGTGGNGNWPGSFGAGGGGGAGLGGAIFVMAGGSLSVSNGNLSGNNAIGGAGGFGGNSGSAGQGLGGAFFNNGSEIVLASSAGKTLNIGDSIAGTGILDLTGAGDFVFSGAISGSQTINISGSGDVTLAGPITGSEIINITGSGDVTVTGSITGSEIINVAGSGNVVLQGPITGNETINYTGTGSLTLPVAHVASAGDLVTAITDVNIGGKLSIARVHTHEIDLTADTALTAGMPKFNLAAGDTVTINTAGHTLDGAVNGAGGGFSFTATASGGGAVLLGNAIPTFDVANLSELVTAFNTINVGGLFSSPNINYVINLGGDVPLGSLSAGMLNLAAGDTLTINTAGHTLNGAVNGNGPAFTFATGASMGTPAFTGHPIATFTVGTIAEFNAALAAINPGGFYYGTNIDYEIDLTADLKLTGNMAALFLAAGDTLTIKGGGHTIDGSVNGTATYSGFDLESGNLVLSQLTIEGTLAHGHDGGSVAHAYAGAGGGGLGAGGGLFIGAGASATLDGVAFTGNSAIGGSGGNGGAAGGYNGYVGGGGPGSPVSGFGIGGAGGWGRQPAFYAHSRSNGLAGSFGGGGGGGASVYRVIPRSPPFFGGDLYAGLGGSGGYGAGSGGGGGVRVPSGGGGGGAGLGGGVFVASGGSLTIQSGSIGGNTVVGGLGGASTTAAGGDGQGIGSGLFTISQNITFAPQLGDTLTVSDAIAGAGVGVVHIAGAGNVTLSGAITGTTIDISNTGTVSLTAGDLVNDSFSLSGSAHYTLANKITGGGTISASGTSVLTITGMNLLTGGMVLSGNSTIDLTSVNSIGSGIITFVPNSGATLIIEAGVTVSNQINGFNPGDTIKLVGFAANATATMGAGNVLTVTDGVHSIDLHLNPGLNFSLFTFDVTAYSGGVMVTDRVPFAITGVVGQPVYGSGVELRGTAAPGTTVTIIANGGTTVLGTGIVDGNGNFDLITSPLADGFYTFQAVSQTGTSSQISAGFAVTVLPSAPVITTQIGHPLNGDTVELKGTALPNQTIKLYLDGSSTVFATGVADANGNFDIVTPALTDGIHTIRATETDSLGLVSPLSAGFIVNVNPTAPTITALVNNPFNGGPIEVKGTGEPNHIIQIFADGGTTVIGTGTTNASGQFDIVTSAGLSNGVHTLTAVALVSNLPSTASNSFSVTVVPSAPVITTLVGQPDNDGTIEVKGTGQPNQTVTLYADGGATSVGTGVIDATGHFDITTTLTFPDGVHRLTATATDAANLVSPVSSQFTVNVIPDTPVISAVLPVSGTSQRIEVQGTGEVGETIKLFADGSTTVLATGVVDATGHFDIFADILGGAHTIRATETNAANLVSVISSGVSVNVTPNAPAITALVGQPINGTTVTVKGTAQHVGGTITLYADGGMTAVGTGTVAANGTFSITTTVTFADAVHIFTATETDDGIASALSPAFTVNVNPIAPTITAQIGTTVEGGALEFVGTGEVGNIVTITLSGVTIGSGIVDATGHFDITTISGLNPGVQAVSVTETNAAHLTSSASGFVATVAPVAPVITSVVSVDDPGGRVEAFGTGKAGDIITLYADGGTTAIGSGTVDQTGHFAIYSTNGLALGDGAHTITATQTLVNGAGSATSAASTASNVNVATTATSFTITSAADLAADIAAIDLTGAYSHANTHYTFNIVGDLVLSTQLAAFNLASGDTLTIHGNGHTLDAHGLPGLFVYSGTIDIDNLSVINAVAKGGDSTSGGGGGAGLGGGLFIASGGAVTLDNVSFALDRAVGGNGSYFNGYSASGGGGMGGAGNINGGGGVGLAASGGSYFGYAPGRGIVIGAAAGGGAGGADGGGGVTGTSASGGGRYGYAGGAGGGIGGSVGTATSGGAGGFGGGGGGGVANPVDFTGSAGGAGGFGGGGGAGLRGAGGTGGFGGGGGGGAGYLGYANGAGGFGGGQGNNQAGGGGLGAGGAIFVQEGGSLTFGGSGGTHDNSVAGGSGSNVGHNSGSGLGSGIFLQGNQTITFAPDAAHIISISDVIADMTGSHDASGQTGAGHLVLDGEGTLVLGTANTFTGGITIENGTLDLTASGAAGSGAIDFSAAGHAALEFRAANAPVNAIEHFGTRDQIIVDGFHATSETFVDGVLVLSGASGSVSLTVSGDDIASLSDFHFAYDSAANTTIITAGPDRSGNDVIHYGAGAHSLTGGTGDDVFFFRGSDLAAGVTDKITDFSWATASNEHDRIHIEGVDPNTVSVSTVNGGHDTDIAISVAGGTAHILLQGVGSGALQIEFQNTTPTDDAHLNTLLTPSTVNETVASFYLGANPPYAKSLVSHAADGSVVAQDVTNNDGSHTVTVQGDNAALTASAANDTFVFQFNSQVAATATIGNFDVAHDVLQLSQSVYADAAAALAAIAADPHNAGNPADTTIALDALHSVTLYGVNPNLLQQRDFLVV
ncbi:adhesin, partial [Bradyrhizobium cajani]|nr:adhesin [Bradyrhizobium cajani]